VPESAYDVIVIGSGPGGYVTTIRAAQLGFKTAAVEKDTVDGRCLNYACIPAKAVLRVADVATEICDAGEFGITVNEPTIDFSVVMNRRNKVVSTLTGGVSGLFKKNQVDLIEGSGSPVGDGKVRVGDDTYEAKFIVLATGSVPCAIPGTEFGGCVIGTEEAWAFSELPKTLAVIGSSASGSEIASGYVRLGVNVHLFEALDRVLPTEDADISKLAERGFKKQGIEVHTGTLVKDVKTSENSVTLTHGEDSGEVGLRRDRGRPRPGYRGPGLDTVGVEARRARVDRGRRRDAHQCPRHLRGRQSGAGPGAGRTRPPMTPMSP
jgi:dihydrolipoamide dehydrogenase